MPPPGTHTTAPVPSWLVVDVVIRDDGSATVRGGPVQITNPDDVTGDALRQAGQIARSLGRPVQVRLIADGVTTRLIADPNGHLSPLPDQAPTRPPDHPSPAGTDPQPAAAASPTPLPSAAAASQSPEAAASQPGAAAWYRAAPTTATVDTARTWSRQGGPWNLSGTTGSAAARRPRRRVMTIVPVTGAGLLLAAVIVISPSWTTTHPTANATRTTPTPAVSSTASPAGASIAAPSSSPPPPLPAAPPGYAAQAAWTQPVAAWTQTAVTDQGDIVTRTPTGQIVRVDAATGHVTWSISQPAAAGWSGPRLTTIDGHTVVALTMKDTPTTLATLAYWRLPAASPPSPTTPNTPNPSATPATRGSSPNTSGPTFVALPDGSTINWDGPSPVVLSPTGGAAVIHGSRTQPVHLPAGARALAADGRAVLAVQATAWSTNRPGAIGRPHPFPVPTGVDGPPVRVEAVDARYLLVAWAKPVAGAQSIALIDTTTGQTLLQTTIDPTLDITRGPLVRQISAGMAAIGPVVVDTYGQRVDTLQPAYQVVALTPGHAWATTNGHPVDITLSTNGTFTVTPFPAAAENVIPFATTRSGTSQVALMLTPARTGWSLTGLPATSTR